ncbi:hypothetical protein KAJ27_09680 [bacterium]|nr:hypothetical protein [bacterium]
MTLEIMIATIIGGVCAGAGGYWSSRLNSDQNTKKMIWTLRFEHINNFIDLLGKCRQNTLNYMIQIDSQNRVEKTQIDGNIIHSLFLPLQQEVMKILLLLKPSERNNFKGCVEELENLYSDFFRNRQNISRVINTIEHIFLDHLDELNIFEDDGYLFEESDH